jgi:hypothetical protein
MQFTICILLLIKWHNSPLDIYQIWNRFIYPVATLCRCSKIHVILRNKTLDFQIYFRLNIEAHTLWRYLQVRHYTTVLQRLYSANCNITHTNISSHIKQRKLLEYKGRFQFNFFGVTRGSWDHVTNTAILLPRTSLTSKARRIQIHIHQHTKWL